MGAPEQPHLPGMEDEPSEPVAATDDVTDDVADDAADFVADDVVRSEETAEPDDPSDDEEPAAAEPVAEAVVEAAVSEEQDDGEPVVEPEPAAEQPVDEAVDEPVDEAADEPAADDEPAAAEVPGGPAGDEQPEPVDVAEHDEPDTDEIPLAAASVEPVESFESLAAGEPAAAVEPDLPAGPADEEPEVPAAAASATPPPARSAPMHRPRERARTRLLEAMKPKASRGQVLAALLCAGLGFGLVTQIQSTQSEQLDALTQSDLVRLLQEVNTKADDLAEQEARARDDRERLVADQTGDLEAEALTRKRLQALGVLAGTLPATGPGIRLTLTDPKGEVDAATLLDTLQEVRDAGAEAVQINDVRIVASTWFEDLDGGVRIGGTPVRPPYTYLVIGDAPTLDAAMRIPGGVLDVVEQKGGTGDVQQLDRVDVTALHPVDDPQYARPAPEASP